MTLGMTGFWGTKFINNKCKEADYVLGLGTRFSEADCSSWDPRFTFNFPPSRLIHIDIDPSEIGRNYPVEIGAVADLKQALKVLERLLGGPAPLLVHGTIMKSRSFVDGGASGAIASLRSQ